MNLNQPCYEIKEDGKYYLYVANFSSGEKGFSPHTSVSGGLPAYLGPYDTEEELQRQSVEMTGRKAIPLN